MLYSRRVACTHRHNMPLLTHFFLSLASGFHGVGSVGERSTLSGSPRFCQEHVIVSYPCRFPSEMEKKWEEDMRARSCLTQKISWGKSCLPAAPVSTVTSATPVGSPRRCAEERRCWEAAVMNSGRQPAAKGWAEGGGSARTGGWPAARGCLPFSWRGFARGRK